jgi:AbrB family looped-hinge helix DNA binding protein
MVAPTLPKAETIELSEDYKIVIPPSMRETLGIRPGQKLQLLVYKGELVIMPEVHPRDVRGSMPDLDTSIERDDERI